MTTGFDRAGGASSPRAVSCVRVVARVVAAMLGAQAVAAAQCSNPWLSANVVALAGQVLFHQVLAVELTAGLPLLGSNGLSLTLGSF